MYVLYCLILYVFKPKQTQSYQAVGDFYKFEEIIPNTLRHEFDINNNVWNKGRMLSGSDVLLLIKIFLDILFHALYSKRQSNCRTINT